MVINDQFKGVSETKSKKDELDINIQRESEKIKHEIFDKLQNMVEDLKNHQLYQKSNSQKLQQEISILKKEKLDLYQKSNELQKRINDMKNTIGQEYK